MGLNKILKNENETASMDDEGSTNEEAYYDFVDFCLETDGSIYVLLSKCSISSLIHILKVRIGGVNFCLVKVNFVQFRPGQSQVFD